MIFLKILLFSLSSVLHGGVTERVCNHYIPAQHEVLHDVSLEPLHLMKKRSINQRLRIREVFHSSVNRLPPDKLTLVKHRLLPAALSYWENTLVVRQTAGPIRLNRNCSQNDIIYRAGYYPPYCVHGCEQTTYCGHVPVPYDHLEACRIYQDGHYHETGYAGRGVLNADFVLYVSAVASSKCDPEVTVAYAAYCQLEGSMDRPVAGFINLCPYSISTKLHDMTEMVSTIKHEILHALGFSAGLFAMYRDKNGDPLTERDIFTGRPEMFNNELGVYQWSSKVVRTVSRRDWRVRGAVIQRHFYLMVTPKVTEEARRHFNCSTLEGAELENQGSIGTKLTHWEKRVFEHEAMTGTYTQNPKISRITLALMEDTGWYRVNYAMAEPLQWGKNLGCDFVKKSCMEWIKMRTEQKKSILPFCTKVKSTPLRTLCTTDRDAVALCNLKQYPKPIPFMYQYFSETSGDLPGTAAQYGGSVGLADYCPYVQEFVWRDRTDTIQRGSRCTLSSNTAEVHGNHFLETYGPNSKCFEHHGIWSLKRCNMPAPLKHFGSGCYKYSCNSTVGLVLDVHGKSYRCYKTGQILVVRVIFDGWLTEGSIVCPSCQEICQAKGVTCPPEYNPPYSSPVNLRMPCRGSLLHPRHVQVGIIYHECAGSGDEVLSH
ncbi:leishmanolysin-like peptidase [Lingula anatina]|uniref:Leishmanolysin-like peptidase n=1 Tax=Lingula anatina TaxID=7574 RepID=A0A1S3IM89_LINAN|nr:leishmanolysin-like peptidase [Lingula anatina]|eukprot:XP_013398644.1 leishmanolysin-like peptidase [Lingula anatina]